MTQPWTRWCPVCTAATAWIRPSANWLPTANSPRLFDGSVVLRGISTLTAFGLAVEIGDWQRLSGRSIGAYLGLVPCEYSSGQSRSQGGLTKTGNTHARRLLIEAAWHHRAHYRPSRDLRRRWDLASASARERGHAANHRLHTRWAGFDKRKKRPVVANAAIARELA